MLSRSHRYFLLIIIGNGQMKSQLISKRNPIAVKLWTLTSMSYWLLPNNYIVRNIKPFQSILLSIYSWEVNVHSTIFVLLLEQIMYRCDKSNLYAYAHPSYSLYICTKEDMKYIILYMFLLHVYEMPMKFTKYTQMSLVQKKKKPSIWTISCWLFFFSLCLVIFFATLSLRCTCIFLRIYIAGKCIQFKL